MLFRHPPLRVLAPAVATLAATLLLGAVGQPVRGVTALLSWGMLGLVLVTAAGLLAWHLARLTALPQGRVQHAGALPAALIPLLALPQIGGLALLVPWLLAVRSRDRGSALALACAPLAVGSPVMLGLIFAGTLALALRNSGVPAANDNPSLERWADLWPMRPLPRT